jgi:hypothetical protein
MFILIFPKTMVIFRVFFFSFSRISFSLACTHKVKLKKKKKKDIQRKIEK